MIFIEFSSIISLTIGNSAALASIDGPYNWTFDAAVTQINCRVLTNFYSVLPSAGGKRIGRRRINKRPGIPLASIPPLATNENEGKKKTSRIHLVQPSSGQSLIKCFKRTLQCHLFFLRRQWLFFRRAFQFHLPKILTQKEQVPTEESSVKSLFIRRNSMADAGQWGDGRSGCGRAALGMRSFQRIFGRAKGATITLV